MLKWLCRLLDLSTSKGRSVAPEYEAERVYTVEMWGNRCENDETTRESLADPRVSSGPLQSSGKSSTLTDDQRHAIERDIALNGIPLLPPDYLSPWIVERNAERAAVLAELVEARRAVVYDRVKAWADRVAALTKMTRLEVCQRVLIYPGCAISAYEALNTPFRGLILARNS
jgi:hypothetical protein